MDSPIKYDKKTSMFSVVLECGKELISSHSIKHCREALDHYYHMLNQKDPDKPK